MTDYTYLPFPRINFSVPKAFLVCKKIMNWCIVGIMICTPKARHLGGAYFAEGLMEEHHILQSMPRKENRMDNGAIEPFFGRLKVEMFYGEKFESVDAFIAQLGDYIDYYNNRHISTKLKGMSPVQYRTHSSISSYFIFV